MAIEIERKFLVRGDAWRSGAAGVLYRQGFLKVSDRIIVRIRIEDDAAFLTVKTLVDQVTRQEFSYSIPLDDAREILKLCPHPPMEKYRYRRHEGGLTWEIDEFLGENEGLIIAEVELDTPDQQIVKPDWIGAEVTDDPRYLNVNLAERPYRQWQQEGAGR
ncbi:MAG: CYTH domain-containing protein [Syntrophales bacterium]|nr:CYTH domain-containing protein [Syntrophales bacterium]